MHAFVGMLRIESGVDALYLELNESTIYTSTISGGWGRETAFGAGGLGRSGACRGRSRPMAMGWACDV